MRLDVLPSNLVNQMNLAETQRGQTLAQAAQAMQAALQDPRSEARFSKHGRMLYATDASLYQVEPFGVVIPGNAEDLARAVEICFEHSVPMLPR